MTEETPKTPSEPVATGDRRDEVRLQPDPDQLVRMRATFKPDAPLPPQEATGRSEAGGGYSAAPPIEDVAVAAPSPSVWDARPEGADIDPGPDETPTGR